MRVHHVIDAICERCVVSGGGGGGGRSGMSVDDHVPRPRLPLHRHDLVAQDAHQLIR